MHAEHTRALQGQVAELQAEKAKLQDANAQLQRENAALQALRAQAAELQREPAADKRWEQCAPRLVTTLGAGQPRYLDPGSGRAWWGKRWRWGAAGPRACRGDDGDADDASRGTEPTGL